jgi:hypothetical protein
MLESYDKIVRGRACTVVVAMGVIFVDNKGAFGREHLTPIDGKHLELEFTV